MSNRTDYAKIAATYDEGYRRKEIPVSALLTAIAAERPEPRVLDVGCGTGNWLAVHRAAFPDAWLTGVDRSKEMLARAREKLPEDVVLLEGEAERLPVDDGAFDLVACNFAFHHFVDKPRALDELLRATAPGGGLRIWNLCPEHQPGWWVHRFFPGTVAIDEARFWSARRIVEALEARGLTVEAKVEVSLYRAPLDALIAEAERRDVSELALIDDDAFRAGVAALREAREAGPTVLDESALLTVRARRPR